MALPDKFAYLDEGLDLAERAFFANDYPRIATSPREEELAIFRRIDDRIEQRNDHNALRGWLSSTWSRDTGRVRSLLRVVSGLMSNGKLPSSERMATLIQQVFTVPAYCEENIPPRLRHLSLWLRRMPLTMRVRDAVEMAEGLSAEEMASLLEVIEHLECSGELDEIYTWLSEVHSDRPPEASRMWSFLSLCDEAVSLTALPADLGYLKDAIPLAREVGLADTYMRVVSCPTGAELELVRRIVDEIDERKHYEALSHWLSSSPLRESGWVHQLLAIIEDLALNNVLKLPDRMEAFLEQMFAEPEYCEEEVPERFRHLGPWLKRISTGWCDGELIELFESLEPEELESLAGLCERITWSGEFDEINAWLNEVDWNECPEAARMYRFLGLCDYAGFLP